MGTQELNDLPSVARLFLHEQADRQILDSFKLVSPARGAGI